MPTTNPLYIVQPAQTILDICIQSAGQIDGLFDCANLNAMGVTDDLFPGMSVIGEIVSPNQQSIVNLFIGHPPASGIVAQQALPGGISYMQIGSTFKVS